MTVPVVTRDAGSTAFFDAAGEATLLIHRCRVCARYSAPAAPTCGAGHVDLDWVPSSGRGRVVSWAGVHGRPSPSSADAPAVKVIAVVELDEGPWLRSRIVDVAPAEVTVGAAVRVVFERAEGGEAVPLFALEEKS